MESMRAIAEQPIELQRDAAQAELAESENAGAEEAAMALESTPTPVRTVPAGLLPWLAALTVAVLYLLGRTLGFL